MNEKEVMKALNICSSYGELRCTDCPYYQHDASCCARLAADALALIEELSAQLEQVAAGRDAAISDISHGCQSCYYFDRERDRCTSSGLVEEYGGCPYWEWRGVQPAEAVKPEGSE